LKRTIQREIETPLARQLLEGKIHDGQIVLVNYDARRHELTFEARTPAEEEEVAVR
jgi:ATP-dependent Clp protease ATP-binding subunit ClpA